MTSIYTERYNDGWKDGVAAGYSAAALAFMYCLHKDFGWNRGRLSAFVNESQRFINGNVGLEKNGLGKYEGIDYSDIADYMQEATGLHIDLSKGIYYFTDKKGRMVSYERSKDND